MLPDFQPTLAVVTTDELRRLFRPWGNLTGVRFIVGSVVS